MFRILSNEILKTYRKWRTYIGFTAIAVFIPLVQIALKLEQGGMMRRMARGLAEEFFLVGNVFNGYFVTQFIMNSLWVHIPFLIVLVAGDQLAGEATGGTFRITLIRPASRTLVLGAKYVATLFYAFTLVIFMAIISLGLGLVLFGSGPLVAQSQAFTVIAAREMVWRMPLAFGLAIVGMWCVASLAFLLSSLVENAIGPIVATMTIIIVLLITSNIPVDFFRGLRPYFFTSYLNVWQEALQQPVAWESVGKDLAVLAGHSVGFYLITWYIFTKKDVLS